MGTFRLKKEDYIKKEINGIRKNLIKKEKWEDFNSTLLGLGNVGVTSNVTSAICAVFDLEGFTNFCKQIDPQLSTPIFLKQFLDWFFQKIKSETMKSEHPEGIEKWHNLPFLTKFLGDGILVIWDTENMSLTSQSNIIISCRLICNTYVSDFYPLIKRKLSEVPTKLRCGIAKGNIFSVGDGNDFVGPCINYASRLQKLPGCYIAFSDRGFNVEENFKDAEYEKWIIKKVPIRGIGDFELVYILASDFAKMNANQKKWYKEP